jgi:hypothetical protein
MKEEGGVSLDIIAWLAQSVERETLNLKAAGSTPALGFIFSCPFYFPMLARLRDRAWRLDVHLEANVLPLQSTTLLTHANHKVVEGACFYTILPRREHTTSILYTIHPLSPHDYRTSWISREGEGEGRGGGVRTPPRRGRPTWASRSPAPGPRGDLAPSPPAGGPRGWAGGCSSGP